MGFSRNLYGYIRQRYAVRKITFMNPQHPYYLFSKDGREFAFICPGVGAPAAGMLLDETIRLGAGVILFWGTAGIFDRNLKDCLILPKDAVSGEGTSRYYGMDESPCRPDPELTARMESCFRKNRFPYAEGRVFTTDAPYRQTRESLMDIKNRDCIAVDMEASALFSVAAFYRKRIAGFLLPSDRVSEDGWEIHDPAHRPPMFRSTRLFELAVDILSGF